jgi:hypothetical protein
MWDFNHSSWEIKLPAANTLAKKSETETKQIN